MKKMIEEAIRKVLGEFLCGELKEQVRKAVAEAIGELLDKEAIGRAFFEGLKSLAEGKARQDAAPPEEGRTETPRQDGDGAEKEPALSWCYGGFDGSKAAVSEEAVLAGARLEGNTLSFSWAKGGCEQLGATSKSDADHTVACLFLEDGAGGKFEWVSTSRKTRSVKNVLEGYNGWPKMGLEGGGKLWFCIAGVKDDQKTSNGLRTACVEVER
ncbi:MAG: hypothetical protein IK066_04505 [Kiritimatiellae bacterium]|nr:hypothetical protein [Kiritimatiellia bacterium]